MRQRVAILGGGPAALAAAWELTRYPGWQERYEVDVYTLGWRLGGKMATGRGASGRIEEHGLHILQGWYHNTFRLMQDVYDERRARGLAPDAPWPRFEDALIKENATLMTERDGEGWRSWQFEMPENVYRPGRGGPLPARALAEKALKIALQLAVGAPHAGAPAWHRALVGRAFRPRESDREAPAGRSSEGLSRVEGLVLRGLRAALARGLVPAGPPPGLPPRLAALADLSLALARGLLRDAYDPAARAFDLDRVDDEDFRAWLLRHGAAEATVRSPLVRFAYTGTFAHALRETDGQVGAGTALRVGAAALGYKGAFVYKLKAGTGDTLLVPWFQVLRARGVRFHFFHRVDEVEAEPGRPVDAVALSVQARPRGGGYDPLVRVKGLDCWPSAPRFDDLAEGDALRASGADLEDAACGWQPVERRRLERGRDFDQVVLAIPVGALGGVCAPLAARSPAWRAMLDGVRTVATRSVQLWTRPDLAALGFDPGRHGMRDGAKPNLVTYANPLYSWLDLSETLDAEDWAERPGSVAYFTGIIHDPEAHALAPAATRHDGVRDETRAWLDAHMGFLWPRAVRAGAFDEGVLAGPYAQQHFRANVDPSARYTLSVPGSRRVRLRAGESGCPNLWLAGDWIDFGLDVGYIDGAVTAGLQAATALRAGLALPLDSTAWVAVPLPPRRRDRGQP